MIQYVPGPRHGQRSDNLLWSGCPTSPAMVYYLDNSESPTRPTSTRTMAVSCWSSSPSALATTGAFNYSEDDVKVCARAFTGWNVAPAYPPFPHGRSPWVFRFDPADHDDSEKTFLGETGNLERRRHHSHHLRTAREPPASSPATCTTTSWPTSRRCPPGA